MSQKEALRVKGEGWDIKQGGQQVIIHLILLFHFITLSCFFVLLNWMTPKKSDVFICMHCTSYHIVHSGSYDGERGHWEGSGQQGLYAWNDRTGDLSVTVTPCRNSHSVRYALVRWIGTWSSCISVLVIAVRQVCGQNGGSTHRLQMECVSG